MDADRIDNRAALLRDRWLTLAWGQNPPRGMDDVRHWLSRIIRGMDGEVVVVDWLRPGPLVRNDKRIFKVPAYTVNDNFHLAAQIGQYALGLTDEWEKNRFASTFLIPPDELAEVVKARGYFDDYHVSGVFGCPYKAVLITAARLGYIT